MSTGTWQHQDRFILVALPKAPYWTRRFTEEVLAKWNAMGLVRDTQLVVTEFVTNAMRATTNLDEAAQQAYIKRPMAVPFQELAEQSRIGLLKRREVSALHLWGVSIKSGLPQPPIRLDELTVVEQLAVRGQSWVRCNRCEPM